MSDRSYKQVSDRSYKGLGVIAQWKHFEVIPKNFDKAQTKFFIIWLRIGMKYQSLVNNIKQEHI